jgi:hypothetical protein
MSTREEDADSLAKCFEDAFAEVKDRRQKFEEMFNKNKIALHTLKITIMELLDELKFQFSNQDPKDAKEKIEELSQLNSMIKIFEPIVKEQNLSLGLLLKEEEAMRDFAKVSRELNTNNMLEVLQELNKREKKLKEEEERDKECPICLEVNNKKAKTECGHIFCRECIVIHIKKNNTECPMCRQKISEKTLVEFDQPKDDIGIVQDSPPSSSGGSRVQDFPQSSSGGSRVQNSPPSSSGGSRVQEQKEEEERRRLLQLRLRRQDDMMARNMLCNF